MILKNVQPNSDSQTAKRICDILLASVGLVVLSPLLLLVAGLILLIEGRPILFRQLRPGLDGQPFWIIKFRTMQCASDDRNSDGARITPLGRILRSTSIDELPELYNILKGEMSLVGPRPLLMSYLSVYSSNQARRHLVRPGITGWAQINGRNLLSWEKRFEFDVWYVENRSFILDLKIILLSFQRVFSRVGISAEGSATMPEFKSMQGENTSSKRSENPNHKIEMSSADICENDIQAVVDVLRSGRLALGPKAVEFEEKMARYIGVRYAVAVSSGTAALHIIMKALGIGEGDEVLVPSFTFAASVNAILYVGAKPVFVDVRKDTYNIDCKDLEHKITPRTKAIMVVDVFGHPADWDEIQKFAELNHLKVIDDCCEALGAAYKGKKLGAFGNAGAFAFYPNKQITTGEGGMIVTNDEALATLARSYRNQGRDEMGGWLEHPRLGYNYRLDEMSAALGSSQLDRIEEILGRRANVATLYGKYLKSVPGLRAPAILPQVTVSWFVYVVTLEHGLSVDGVMKALSEKGIPSRAYFSPIHLQNYIQNGAKEKQNYSLPQTDDIAGRTLALPFHTRMTEKEVRYITTALNEVIARQQAALGASLGGSFGGPLRRSV